MADIKTLTTDAFTAMCAAQPNCTVAVVANSNTVTGWKDTKTSEPDLTDNGETGVTTGRVWCVYADIGAIEKGQTITVAGVSVFALRTRLDPAGALIAIDYSEQRPRA